MQMVFAGVLAALMAFAPALTGWATSPAGGQSSQAGSGAGRRQPAHRQMFAGGRGLQETVSVRVPVTEFGSCDLR